jgi:hypothetical protein
MDPQDSKQTQLLEELLKWVRFTGMKEVKSTLEALLDTEQKKISYHLSDGSRGVREISILTGLGKNKIPELWRLWTINGLGAGVNTKVGKIRFKRSFNILDFGLSILTVVEPFQQKKEEVKEELKEDD